MASTYVLNGQISQTSVGLNGGVSSLDLGGLTSSDEPDPYGTFGLAASLDKDVLGTAGSNQLVVSPTGGQAVTWKVELNGILPNSDVQIVVFANRVLARQGHTTAGFDISGPE